MHSRRENLRAAWARPAIRGLAGGIAAGLIVAAAASAQRIPLRVYDVRDGLANERVTSIVQDPQGYLWFATWEGLSRFDGYRFTSYGPEAGLDPPIVFGLAQDHAGRLWAGLWGGGVARLRDIPPALRPTSETLAATPAVKFVCGRVGAERTANLVGGLVIDAHDVLWCTTGYGLYRAALTAVDSLAFELVLRSDSLNAIALGGDDSVWIGDGNRLVRVVNGTPVACDAPRGRSDIADLACDGEPGVIVAREHMIERCIPGPGGAGSWTRLPIGIPADADVRCLLAARDGALWTGTSGGLVHFTAGHTTLYTRRQGLADDFVRALFEDRDGNLWIATNQVGVCKFSGERIVSFTDELPGPAPHGVVKLVQGRDGRLYATVERTGVVEIRADGIDLLPGSEAPLFRNLNVRLTQDELGDWWAATDSGAFRFPGPRLQFEHGRRFGRAEGIGDPYLIGVAADTTTHRIWVGRTDLWWHDVRSDLSPAFHHVPIGEASGLMGLRVYWRDPRDRLWIAAFSGLGWLQGETPERLTPAEGLPSTDARTLFRDSRGWLWVGLRHAGVSVTRDPAALHPTFTNYSMRDGLASNTVWAVAEDDSGRIYLGTGRGLDQLDVATGRIQHYGTVDGLAGETVPDCLRDRAGRIWLATSNGVSRFDPQFEPPPAPAPPIYIVRVEVAGVDLALPERGTVELARAEFPARSDNLRVEFVGLSFRGEDALRYQYRLEGADAGFRAPTDQRSVYFAHLAPGRYRFVVRALAPDGTTSPRPASFEFRILPPVWRRVWFVVLAAAALAGMALALHRARVRQIVAMGRIRQQIALDLHDDVGSGLSQIAILSEVARREAPPETAAMLEESANLARALRSSMADIVWAIDPRQDRLVDLVRRMRQTAYNLLEADGMQVEFIAPDDSEIERIGLAPDRRRQVLLFFKEAIANVGRHAQAHQVEIRLEVQSGAVVLEVRDDGRGFDPNAASLGNGLRSMQQRAATLGATLAVDAAPGRGTAIRLQMPLRRR